MDGTSQKRILQESDMMCPSDALWESNVKKRNLKGRFEGYKNQAREIEFPNVAEGIDEIYEVVDGEVRS